MIEIDDPNAVRFVVPTPELPGSALMAAAGQAINTSKTSQEAFGERVAKLMATTHTHTKEPIKDGD